MAYFKTRTILRVTRPMAMYTHGFTFLQGWHYAHCNRILRRVKAQHGITIAVIAEQYCIHSAFNYGLTGGRCRTFFPTVHVQLLIFLKARHRREARQPYRFPPKGDSDLSGQSVHKPQFFGKSGGADQSRLLLKPASDQDVLPRYF